MRSSRLQHRSPEKPKSPGKRKSPGRPKGSRRKSPGRPSRSPTRRKSPARSSQSPARRSTRIARLTPTRRNALKRSPVRLFQPEEASVVAPQPRLKYDSDSSVDFEEVEPKSIAKSSPNHKSSWIAPSPASGPPIESLNSDSDDFEFSKTEIRCKKSMTPSGPSREEGLLQEAFRQLYGFDMRHNSRELFSVKRELALLMFTGGAISALIYSTKLHVPVLSLCLTPLMLYVCLMSFILAISLLPLPNLLNALFPSKQVPQKCNGALCLLVLLLAAALSANVPPSVAAHFPRDWVLQSLEFLDQHELGLLMAAWGVGMVLTFGPLVLGAHKKAPTAVRLLGCDLKELVLRTELVTEVLLVLLRSYAQMEKLPVLAYAIYRLYLCALRLLFERVVVASTAVQATGNSFFVTRLLMPYLNAWPLREPAHTHELATWHWGAVGLCFGLMLCSQLLNFWRLCRPKPELLDSGLWGASRHPEYVGAILGEVAAQSLLLSLSWVDLAILFRVYQLCKEAYANDAHSFLKFRMEWVRYCSKTACLLGLPTTFKFNPLVEEHIK